MAAGADDGLVGALRQRGDARRRIRLSQVGPGLFGEILRQRHQVALLEPLRDRRHLVTLARAGLEIAQLKEEVAEILAPDRRHREGLFQRHAVLAVTGRADLRLFFDALGVRSERENRKGESKRDRQSSHSIYRTPPHKKSDGAVSGPVLAIAPR